MLKFLNQAGANRNLKKCLVGRTDATLPMPEAAKEADFIPIIRAQQPVVNGVCKDALRSCKFDVGPVDVTDA
ncbi:hypothetical protein BH11PLA2_BH11PLA2_46110 [soil metagenome]